MSSAPRRQFRSVLLFATAIVVTGCATGVPHVEPVDVPRLQQEAAASPDDAGLQVQLGIAQFKAGDYASARTALRGAREAGDESGPMYLYLGLAEEEMEDWSAAREAYNVYLSVGSAEISCGPRPDRL
jgi:Tfp pilus assembly protein PilF